MRALRFDRNLTRFAAATAASRVRSGAGARYGPLRLRDVSEPELPAPSWERVQPRLAGICGSDLATVDGRSSRYFEPLVSFPFVPGHEVVADRAGTDGEPGSRVVIEPVLGCITRGISPPCAACAEGRLGGCERTAFGALEPGLQTGYCCDTGGGWSTAMVAHESQLHTVPEDWADEAAVMVEPTACGVHGALAGDVATGETVAVIGAGTLGLVVTAALRRFTGAGPVVVAAKHPHQRALARELGADVVVGAGELARAVRRATGTLALGNGKVDGRVERLTGGADVVIDCVGSETSLASALSVVRPRGRVVMVGMPGTVTVDLTGLWHREVDLVGAYAYGIEAPVASRGEPRRTFDLAFELVGAAEPGRLVSAGYPLDPYTDAIAHAADAGTRGAVKIAFDLRTEKERRR